MRAPTFGGSFLTSVLLLLASLGLIGLLAGCSESPETPVPEPPGEDPLIELHQSELPRNLSPDDADVPELVRGLNQFGCDIYQALADTDGNLLVSPLSIHLAFAMVFAGALGETEEQMAATLRYTLHQDRLHNAYDALDLTLKKRNLPGNSQQNPVELCVANAFWGQTGFPFRTEYLDLLAVDYGSAGRCLDFQSLPDSSRQVINRWVEDRTRNRIRDLMPEGSITGSTAAVLTNALYFKAPWAEAFDKRSTADGTFHLLDGTEVTVPMMRDTKDDCRLTEEADCVAVEVPYRGKNLALLVLLPPEGQFAAFEASLDADRLSEILGRMWPHSIFLVMPSFTFESSFSLKETLAAMGMATPFDPGRADLGGMADFDLLPPGMNLFISDAFHKTFICVNEEGTEAAAATGIGIGVTSAPELVVIDRPFLFVIRDRPTGAILFLGRVLNPAA